VPSVSETIETISEWMDGNPHTVAKIKRALLALAAWRLDGKLACVVYQTAIDSGITYEEIVAAKNDLNTASLVGSAMMNLDHYDSLELHTVDQKRRRLDIDEDIVIVDHDPDNEGIQAASATDVNITNDSLHVHTDVNVTLTSAGLAKLNGSVPIAAQLLDSQVSFITQKLTNMITGVLTIISGCLFLTRIYNYRHTIVHSLMVLLIVILVVAIGFICLIATCLLA
jgi:hypothetical protein